MVDIKNIIIIGKVGSGKSTLANVLSGTEAFKEDSSSIAETWRTKDKEFEVDLQEGDDKGIKYRIIDTVGLESTMMNENEKKELLTIRTAKSKNNLYAKVYQNWISVRNRTVKTATAREREREQNYERGLFDGEFFFDQC